MEENDDQSPLLVNSAGGGGDTDALNGSTSSSTAVGSEQVKTSLRDVAWLAFAFLLLFSAFTVSQNLASSIFLGSVGFWSLGTLYIVFAIVNLFASSITRMLGFKVALFAGATAYVWYVVANVISIRNDDDINVQYGVMIPSAALLGAGAATIWTAQGAYVTYCSNEADLGTANGVFFFIFLANQILGNIGAAILLGFNVSKELVFEILAGAGALGLVFFLPLRRVEGERSDIKKDSTKQSRWAILLEVFLLMADWRMMAVAPLIVYSGITQSFFAGNVPLFINDFNSDGQCSSDLSIKLYVMACLGLAASLGSIVFGKISDKLGRLPILAVAAVVQLFAYLLLYLLDVRNNLAILIPAAVGLGLGDAIINTQSYGILGFLFRDKSEAAFATFKFYQSGATGVLFFASTFLVVQDGTCVLSTESNISPAMDIWLPILVIGLALAAAGLITLRIRGVPLDAVSTGGPRSTSDVSKYA